MRPIDSALVDIARDFLDAHQAVREVASRHRSGDLRFEQVVSLVGDDEASVLFRLKERCHRAFRIEGKPTAESAAGSLFDLAVGSLFHEAMKFRENVYTRDVYGPRVLALRDADVPDAAGLLRESDKIIEDSALRLEESLAEAETLLAQTARQFRVLLAAHPGHHVVTRFLVEKREQVLDVLGDPVEAVLAEVFGSASEGLAVAAHSYLTSGFYEPVFPLVDEALAHGVDADRAARLRTYAEGMQAYLEGRYGDALGALQRWAGDPPAPEELPLARIAATALSRLGSLVAESDDAALAADATALADALHARVAAAA